MEYEKLITERYSVRNFRPEHLSAEDISKILEAAHKAPTGCNYQPQRILVLNNERSLEKLKKCTKCHFNAPTAMLVCYNEGESWKRCFFVPRVSVFDPVLVNKISIENKKLL